MIGYDPLNSDTPVLKKKPIVGGVKAVMQSDPNYASVVSTGNKYDPTQFASIPNKVVKPVAQSKSVDTNAFDNFSKEYGGAENIGSMPGINKDVIPGVEGTQFNTMPSSVQQDIRKEIATAKPSIKQEVLKSQIDPTQSLADLIATTAAKPTLTKEELNQKFPEFSGKEQAVADFLATTAAKPNMTPEDIKAKFPEFYGDMEQPKEESKGFIGETVSDVGDRLSTFVDYFKDSKVSDFLPGGDKSINRTLLRAGGTVAGAANDIIGNTVNSLISRVGADKPIGELVKKITDTEIGKKGIELYQKGAEAFKSFEAVHPEYAQDIKDVWELAQFAPVPPITKAISKTKAGKIVGETLDNAVKKVEGLKTKYDEFGLPKTADETAGKIVQGEIEDQVTANRGLKSVDTKGVKTYEDLSKRLANKEKEIITKQKDYLSKDTRTFGPDDVTKTTKVGDTVVKDNFVNDAIDDLKEIYSKNKDSKGLATITELEKKFQRGELTNGDINDLAIKYNMDTKSSFSKTGDPLTSVTAVRTENVRKGLKNTLRDNLPDDYSRGLDLEYSDIATTKQLIDKMAEGVNKLRQKTKIESPMQKIYKRALNVIDTVSGGGLKAIKQYFGDSNIGNKINNFLDMEGDLPKLLKNFERLTSKIDDTTDAGKKAFEAEVKLLEKRLGQGLPIKPDTTIKQNADFIATSKGLVAKKKGVTEIDNNAPRTNFATGKAPAKKVQEGLQAKSKQETATILSSKDFDKKGMTKIPAIGYGDQAPKVGDFTSKGKIVDTTHGGGGAPQRRVKVEGDSNWTKASDIEIYRKQGLETKQVPKIAEKQGVMVEKTAKVEQKPLQPKKVQADEVMPRDMPQEPMPIKNKLQEIKNAKGWTPRKETLNSIQSEYGFKIDDLSIEDTNKLAKALNGNTNPDKAMEIIEEIGGKYGKKFMKDTTTITNDKPITVYRGEGKGIGNTTFVKGKYFADSKDFASTFGNVTEHTIPKGQKIFDFDTIKNNLDQKIIPQSMLVDPDRLTKYLIDEGYTYTKNTNTRGVEYVELIKPKNDVFAPQRQGYIDSSIEKLKKTTSYNKFNDSLSFMERESIFMKGYDSIKSFREDNKKSKGLKPKK